MQGLLPYGYLAGMGKGGSGTKLMVTGQDVSEVHPAHKYGSGIRWPWNKTLGGGDEPAFIHRNVKKRKPAGAGFPVIPLDFLLQLFPPIRHHVQEGPDLPVQKIHVRRD